MPARTLKANPDVARGVSEGKCPSAQAHYAASGYYEGRPQGAGGFDEGWYVARYPDVKRAILLGQSASGHEHYRGPGAKEWRSPNRAAEADIARWRHAVSEAASKPKSAAASVPAAKSAPPTIRQAMPRSRVRAAVSAAG